MVRVMMATMSFTDADLAYLDWLREWRRYSAWSSCLHTRPWKYAIHDRRPAPRPDDEEASRVRVEELRRHAEETWPPTDAMGMTKTEVDLFTSWLDDQAARMEAYPVTPGCEVLRDDVVRHYRDRSRAALLVTFHRDAWARAMWKEYTRQECSAGRCPWAEGKE